MHFPYGHNSFMKEVGAAQTDSALVAAPPADRRIRVLGLILTPGGTATTAVLTSKPGGAGTAISQVFNMAANSPVVVPVHVLGYWSAALGEGLSVTTGAGSAVGVTVLYSVIA